MSLKDTLGSDAWLKENEAKIQALLPKDWTHIENIRKIQLFAGLKLVGIDIKSTIDYGYVMVHLERKGILLRDNMNFKGNPHSIFKEGD